LNIYDDSKYKNKYVFHIGDIVGIIQYIFKINNIEEKKISSYLMVMYASLLSESFSKEKIKTEFIIMPEEKKSFIEYNNGLYKEEEDYSIVCTKDLSKDELQSKYLCMPIKMVEIVLDDEIQTKILEIYEEEKPKILEK